MKQHVFLVLYMQMYIFCETGRFRGKGSLVGKSRKFQGVGGIKLKNPLWEGYGYFLEPHNELLPNTSLNTCLTENPRDCIA